MKWFWQPNNCFVTVYILFCSCNSSLNEDFVTERFMWMLKELFNQKFDSFQDPIWIKNIADQILFKIVFFSRQKCDRDGRKCDKKSDVNPLYLRRKDCTRLHNDFTQQKKNLSDISERIRTDTRLIVTESWSE